ncbi:unnamed protein product [Mytilus coruscus]|uniref:Uncharacterized protein n=1 Tax=Mytilus coruscus TaxID=42192 RepID=A0A6J7ZUW0_MYTCO|nr:unnamed protein product [Mytilus coruscus]
MDFPDLSEGSSYMSAVLKACGITLPLVKIKQNAEKYQFGIHNLFNGKPCEVLGVGSCAEGLTIVANQQIEQSYSSDSDIILIFRLIIYENEKKWRTAKASHPKLCHYLRLPDANYPGYAQLFVSEWLNSTENVCLANNTMNERLLKSNAFFSANFSRHGPALKSDKDLPPLLEKEGYQAQYINLVDFKQTHVGESEIKSKDFVYCIRGEKWPVEASEYKTRKRRFNWPTKQLFYEIIESGYFLASVGSKESKNKENEVQWRVSFNKAEQLIIESFNETQIHCLMILKNIKNKLLPKAVGKNITSYTMKTVMFWCLEETPDTCWHPSNLMRCVCFCISKLKQYLEKVFLPNYFIRKRNQFTLIEFPGDIQTRTKDFLENFLDNPQESMSVILSTFNDNRNLPPNLLNDKSQDVFIEQWLRFRVAMAQTYHLIGVNALWTLYDGYSVNHIIVRCNDVLEKLKILKYASPFMKLSQNCMGVLQYIILRNEKEKNVSELKQLCLENMVACVPADRTHTILRIATCLLDFGAQDECLHIIQNVTNHKKIYFSMSSHSKIVAQLVKNTTEKFSKMSRIRKIQEVKIYEQLINQDLINQDPYTLIEKLKNFKEEGHEVGGYFLFVFLWKGCCFEVTFMPAEVVILPKPAALELCVQCNENKNVKKVSFHPILYRLLLEFLWHVKNVSPNAKKKKILKDLKQCVSKIPKEIRSEGFNFIFYCLLLQHNYRSAYKYLIK